jgi:hypothetical protein
VHPHFETTRMGYHTAAAIRPAEFNLAKLLNGRGKCMALAPESLHLVLQNRRQAEHDVKSHVPGSMKHNTAAALSHNPSESWMIHESFITGQQESSICEAHAR